MSIKKIVLVVLFFASLSLAASIYSRDKVYFLCPIEYKGDIIVRNYTRGDGFFASPRSGKRLHNGIDLLAEVGTPVRAARSGRVIAATSNNGMGNFIRIQHADTMVTLYGHLSAIYVSNNQRVRQGQVIGAVGKTGNARYRDMLAHLHFEVRKDGILQDPSGYLK